MPDAARVGDNHTCPVHTGGPIDAPASPNVDTNTVAQARAGDPATCAGPKDMIITGSKTVYVNGIPAARKTDKTVHKGAVAVGSSNVEIGGAPIQVMRVGDQVRIGGSRAWRNNNPGNIVAGKWANAHGAIGSDGHMAVFPDEATGKAAIGDLLRGDGYKNLSISDAMQKYAPPFENDTTGYINALHNATGLDTSRTVGSLSDAEMGSFTSAIQQHEGWIPGTTSP
jgi:uncharacterized Zn-binding protein involved in type VI secretion